jgi:hypothetical protein
LLHSLSFAFSPLDQSFQQHERNDGGLTFVNQESTKTRRRNKQLAIKDNTIKSQEDRQKENKQ